MARKRRSEIEATPLTSADYRSLAAFRYALRRFLSVTEEGARGAGITPQQHQLLLAVKGRPDDRNWASISELAESLRLRHHAAVGLVDRCERSGLVRRRPSTEDRRQVRVVLTPKGERILARLTDRNRDELRVLRQGVRLPLLEKFRRGGR